MAFDPFLYVAFAAGFVAGRLVGRRYRWVEHATMATVVALLALLGASLAQVPPSEIVGAIPLALLFTALVFGFTTLFALFRPQPSPRQVPVAGPPARRFPWEILFVGSLVLGYFLLGPLGIPTDTAIEWALYVLLALVAFDLRISLKALRTIGTPLGLAAAGALVAAGVMVVGVGLSVPVALATALGFGWYTLAGPLVAAKVGPGLGLVAFLTNYLREFLTMVSAPALGPRLGGEGVSALGGATSMDTTLYFVVRFGDPEAGSLALATGLVLTIAAGVLLPLLLGLPGA